MKAVKGVSVFIALSLLIGLFGGVLFVSGASADITGREQLGEYSHYNGIIFDYFESERADIEGALAVGGQSLIGTSGQYDFGASVAPNYHYMTIGQYNNPKGYPSLLLNEAPRVGTNNQGQTYIQVYGGPLVLNEDARAGYGGQISATTKYAASGIVNDFFTEAEALAFELTETIAGANTKHSVALSSITGWTVNMNSVWSAAKQAEMAPDNLPGMVDGEKILVLNVTSGSHATINGFQFPDLSAYDLVFINFPDAQSVTFTGSEPIVNGTQLNPTVPRYMGLAMTRLLDEYCAKLVWNFPHAQTIQVSGTGVTGSVIAPDAYVEGNGGSLNGMLLANSLKAAGGFELHGFKIKDRVFEFRRYTGSVELVKYETGTTTLLPGAKFDLEKREGSGWTKIGTYTTVGYHGEESGSYGRIRVEGLREGDYRFVEVAPPEGYAISSESVYPFTIAKGGRDYITLPITAYNDKITGELTLRKVDANDGTGLAGAHFMLYTSHSYDLGDDANPDPRLDMYLVDSSVASGAGGYFTLMGLNEGYYYLLEYDAPDGYALERQRVYQIRMEVQAGNTLTATQVWELDIDIADIDLDNPVGLENTGAGSVPHTNLVWDGSAYLIPNSPTAPTGSVMLVKTDVGGATTLQGAQFALETHDGGWTAYNDKTYTTNLFGVVEIHDLPLGRYRFKELAAPSGYTLTGSGYSDEFGITDAQREVTIRVENPQVTGDVTLTKVDAETTAGIPGASFLVYKSSRDHNGSLHLSLWQNTPLESDGSGLLPLTGLTEGHYYLVEAEAPDGYIANPTQVVQVSMALDAAGAALIPTVYLLTVPEGFALEDLGSATSEIIAGRREIPVPYNIPNTAEVKTPGRLEILKVGDGGSQLAGAQFILWAFEGGAWREWGRYTTGQTGRLVIEDLPLGEYRLEETRAPDGYALPAVREWTFTVDANGTVDAGAISGGSITITNNALAAGVTFKKQDANGVPLEGAMFELYKSERLASNALRLVYMQTASSDAAGDVSFSGLTEGFYYFAETEAPEGYEPDDTIYQVHVALNAEGTGLEPVLYEMGMTLGDIDMGALENLEAEGVQKTRIDGMHVHINEISTRTDGRLVVYKTDKVTHAVMEGVAFTLYRKDGSPNGTFVDSKATNAAGTVTFENLTPGETYRLEETTPNGYTPAAPQEITISDNGVAAIEYVHIENQPAEVDVSFVKVGLDTDGSKTPLSGARFMLYQSSRGVGNILRLRHIQTATSQNNGSLTFTGLTEGHYYFVESSAPDGYTPSGNVYQITVAWDTGAIKAQLYLLEGLSAGDFDLLETLEVPQDGSVTQVPLTGTPEIVNEKIPPEEPTGSAVVVKLDPDRGHTLAGAEFALYDATGTTLLRDGLVTDAYGMLRIEGLTQGWYLLRETKAPDGYLLTGSVDHVFEIDLGGTRIELFLPVENQTPTTSLTLTKTEAGNSANTLAGAKFNLYRSTKNLDGSLQMRQVAGALETDGSGLLTLDGLYEGFYYLVEYEAPDGYYLEHGLKILQIEVTLDAANGLAVQLRELVIPDLGEVNLDNPGSVATDGSIAKHDIPVGGAYAGGFTANVENERRPAEFGSLTLRKTDRDSGDALPGAEFLLEKRGSGGQWEEYRTLATNALGLVQVARLPEGTYRVTETSPPAGYTHVNGTPWSAGFTIAGGANPTLEVDYEVPNVQLPGTLRIVKVEQEERGGVVVPNPDVPLQGTTFELYYWKGYPTYLAAAPLGLLDVSRPTYVTEGTTGPDGSVEFTGLAHGWYTVVETKAPTGYYLDGKIVDTVEVTGENRAMQVVDFSNTKILGDITLVKQSDDDTPLALESVEFQLSQLANREFVPVDLGYALKTDSSGTLTIQDLPEGIYKLAEVDNPNTGFTDEMADLLFAINDEKPLYAGHLQIGLEAVNYRAPLYAADLNLLKTDDAGRPLAGAAFALYDYTGGTQGSRLASATSGSGGALVFEDLVSGHYLLVEAAAPNGFARLQSPIEFELVATDAETTFTFAGLPQGVGFDEGTLTLTVQNSPATAIPGLNIIKVDGSLAYSREAGEWTALAGATFELERAEAENGDYWHYATIETNAKGELLMPELRAGFYRLAETKAPEGYALSATVYEFAVRDDGNGGVVGSYGGQDIDPADDGILFIPNQPLAVTPPVEPEPDPGPGPGPDPNPGNPENPGDGSTATGDSARTAPYLLGALASLCLLGLLVLLRLRVKANSRTSRVYYRRTKT